MVLGGAQPRAAAASKSLGLGNACNQSWPRSILLMLWRHGTRKVGTEAELSEMEGEINEATAQGATRG